MFKYQDENAPLNERVADLASRLTVDEKIALLPTRQEAVPRLSVKEYHIGGEGAHGLVMRRDGEKSQETTVFPQPFGLSMTWDEDLMNQIGGVIGDEGRYYYDKSGQKACLTLWFPTIDMERDPRWGRNEEAYGEDPFLAGKLSASLIRGAQGTDEYFIKLAAGPKHFYANNFERDRSFTDSVIPERLKREYYLRVFAYAFEEGGAVSLMTAYNKINGTVGMLNPELDTVLREEWGCEGYFVCDGGAFNQVVNFHHAFETHAETVAAAIKAGLNVFVDNPELIKQSAREALERGLITEADIDKAIMPTLRIRYRLGHFDHFNKTIHNPYEGTGKICTPEAAELVRKAHLESVVLIKNDGFLPLNTKEVKNIAVLGSLANENQDDWYSGYPPYRTTPLEAFSKIDGLNVTFHDGCDIVAIKTDDGAWVKIVDGKVLTDAAEEARSLFKVYDWGYGAFAYKELESGKYLTTTEDGEVRCDANNVWGWFVRELFFGDGKTFKPERPHGATSETGVALGENGDVYEKPYAPGAVDKVNAVITKLRIVALLDGLEEASQAAQGKDAVIVVVGNHTLVGARECIDRENLEFPPRFKALFAAAHTVNPNVVLTVIAGYPYDIREQESSARAVLFTAHGAQGIGAGIADVITGRYNPAGRLSQTWYNDSADFPDINNYDIMSTGMTYLYYDKPVHHPFGYGLSYTRFEYAEQSVLVGQGHVSIVVTVKNVGDCAGDEVAQCYFTHIDAPVKRPLKQLCGFKRVHIARGASAEVTFNVPFKELLAWDEKTRAFALLHGIYKFAVGGSSADEAVVYTVEI
ncbi:MAG: glycoside hydrolase family 3 C-terminal domain-containing protein [Clostridiales bacterium]|nr:glycoside hydrolase family 3 C-terminal domain-containing protein [Clostridiales bacterium]